MYAYKIKLPQTVPSTAWACKTTVTNYKWKNTNKKNMIELSLSKASGRRVWFDKIGALELKGSCFCCSVGDEKRTSEADEGVSVEILSVALCFDKLEATLCKIENEKELEDDSVLLIPLFENELSWQELCELEALFYRYIHCYVEHSAKSEAMRVSIIFEIFCFLDTVARKKARALLELDSAGEKDKYVNYYVSKAQSIIKRRYAEKLTLNQTAKELGITPSYLSTVFRESTGSCFSHKLLQVRMEKSKELILDGSLSVKQIAEAIGFEDESHFRKRFKRYYGASIREFVCINKEQTLYHKKPTV